MDESFIIANRTDVGQLREVNEDSMVTFDSPNGRVIAVCDGMGGQAAGDVASALACDIITDILSNNKFDTPTEAITRACIAANQGIIHKAAQNPNLEGMGATCVMVIIKDGLVYYGWIGDSRIYYISNGNIQQLTRDQSYVQQLVDQGQITAAEAENHPQKNQILNALGLPNMTPPELCTTPLSPAPGSVILLCSDGLSGMVDDATIQSIIANTEQPLQQRADALVAQANANGGTDNITVQLVQFGKPGAAAGAKKSAAGSSAGGSKYIMWGLIVAAVIIAAALFTWIFTDGREEAAAAKEIQTQVETKKSHNNTNNAPKTTVKVQEQKAQPKADSKKNNKNEKSNKTFGTKQKGNGEAAKEKNKLLNQKDNLPTPEHNDPDLDKAINEK